MLKTPGYVGGLPLFRNHQPFPTPSPDTQEYVAEAAQKTSNFASDDGADTGNPKEDNDDVYINEAEGPIGGACGRPNVVSPSFR